jgi:4-hydroxy-tetrahydrodipicolinate synthase
MTNGPYFGHVVTAMVTIFDEHQRVDEAQTAAVARYLAANGSQGLVVCGTTGESATLSSEEKIRLYQLVKEAVDHDICVIAGTGSNNTAESVALTKAAAEIGVDGVLVVAPYYNKPSQEGMYQHFKAIAQASRLPVMLYNVPGRTSSNLLPPTVKRLANDLPNIVAIKEATGDLSQVAVVASEAGRGFEIYSGDDFTTLPILAVGGVGVVSVSSHVIGNDLLKMHELWVNGKFDEARAIHLKQMALSKALFCTSNPVPVKYALEYLGVIDKARYRLPLVEATAEEKKVVEDALTAYGIGK